MIKSQLHLRHCNKESFGRDERIQQVPEWKVSRGNNAFSSSVGINELFYYMHLLGLLFFPGGNKVPNLAACFHSLRTICNHRLKGSVSRARLWGVLYAYVAARPWVEWTWRWGAGEGVLWETSSPFPKRGRLLPSTSGKTEWTSLRELI